MARAQPSISVITCVYNGSATVERTLHSVRAQSYTTWEHIIVDDCSDDDTVQVIERQSKKEPRLKLIRSDRNLGPGAARNSALRLASGQWIAYLDADDEFYPEYLTYISHLSTKADVLVFGYDAVDDGAGIIANDVYYSYYPSDFRTQLMERNVAVPLGVAHRSCLLERVGLFIEDRRVKEDWDLWKRFARAGAEFAYLPIKSGLYHIRPDSRSRTTRLLSAAEVAGIAPNPPSSARNLPGDETPVARLPTFREEGEFASRSLIVTPSDTYSCTNVGHRTFDLKPLRC